MVKPVRDFDIPPKPELPPVVPQGYALIEGAHAIVLPVGVAMQVFALLCKGEKVSYDWQSKTYRRTNDSAPTLKAFSIAEYATLHLKDPMKD